MRRGVFILAICLLFLALGCWGLAFGPSNDLNVFNHLRLNRVLGLSFFFLAALSALSGALSMHIACQRLIKDLRQVQASGSLERLASAGSDVDVLVDGINGIVELAERR